MKRSVLLGLVLGAACLLTVSPAFAAATLAVNNACALNGTNFGLQVSLDGAAGGPAYVQYANPVTDATFRALFWIKPTTLNNGGVEKEHTVFSFHNPGDGVAVVRVDLKKLVNGNTRVRAVCRRDDGTYVRTAFLTLNQTTGQPEPERQIVLEWANGAGTGFCRITRQGGPGTPITSELLNLDNDTLTMKRARGGAVVGIDAGLSGNYCNDEYQFFR